MNSNKEKNRTEVFNHGYVAGYNQAKVDNDLMTQKEADKILESF